MDAGVVAFHRLLSALTTSPPYHCIQSLSVFVQSVSGHVASIQYLLRQNEICTCLIQAASCSFAHWQKKITYTKATSHPLPKLQISLPSNLESGFIFIPACLSVYSQGISESWIPAIFGGQIFIFHFYVRFWGWSKSGNFRYLWVLFVSLRSYAGFKCWWESLTSTA